MNWARHWRVFSGGIAVLSCLMATPGARASRLAPDFQRSHFSISRKEVGTLFHLTGNGGRRTSRHFLELFRHESGKSPKESFTLKELVRIGYYTPEEAKYYRRSEEGLLPEQILYAQVLRTDARKGRRQSLVRMVSGQVLNAATGEFEHRPLASIPESWADRGAYPVQFEIGRVRNLDPRYVKPLLALTAWTLFRETRIQRKSPSETFVFLRTRGASRCRRYKRLGFEVLNAREPGPHDSFYMVIRLDKLMRRYPPEHFLPVSAELAALFPDAPVDAQAQLLEDLCSMGTQMLDVKMAATGKRHAVEWIAGYGLYRKRVGQLVRQYNEAPWNRYPLRGSKLAAARNVVLNNRQLSRFEEHKLYELSEAGADLQLEVTDAMVREFNQPNAELARLLVNFYETWKASAGRGLGAIRVGIPVYRSQLSLSRSLRELGITEAPNREAHIAGRRFFVFGASDLAQLRKQASLAPSPFTLEYGVFGAERDLKTPFRF